MKGLLETVGGKFGLWTVLAVTSPDDKYPKLTCKCDCGVVRDVDAGSVLRGTSRSCGCLSRDVTSARSITHGKSHDPEYAVWRAIISRCGNPNDFCFGRYGGRGITVSEEWKDFNVFYLDMGPRPREGMSIDRIDNSKGYSRNNCRWATNTQQQRNKRNNRIIEYQGVPYVMAELAEKFGIKLHTFHTRLTRGWSVSKAVETPVRVLQYKAGNPRQINNVRPCWPEGALHGTI